MSERRGPQTDRERVVFAAMEAVRSFTDAMDRMHGGLRGDMDMNATDLAALRMLIVREGRGEPVTPHRLAEHLAITTASTTKLLDRLTESGYVERLPHPTDRRARVVAITAAARADFFRHMAERMRRMREAMTPYSDDELRAVVRFLEDMEVALAGREWGRDEAAG
ncbi:MarR family transcriptional regulator [Microbacterium sp. W1N]|uniref:MarR family winged helix-turn-helix transcriptional regulator n=1 Tax=Microbacterium festucae TaxID=2977531 RepID=UPI0021C0F4D8|nr:MarR family transcriptional regulator [Microbacterium festucae]MCT9820426.1 MarR family transcriptional regulator [Microbacterium festucae]